MLTYIFFKSLDFQPDLNLLRSFILLPNFRGGNV
jgi:hypothetical protein